MGDRTKNKKRRQTVAVGIDKHTDGSQADQKVATVTMPAGQDPKMGRKMKKRSKVLSSSGKTNWEMLKTKLRAEGTSKSDSSWGVKQSGECEASTEITLNVTSSEKIHRDAARTIHSSLTKVLALDCEMVGSGPGGECSVLARVSIVNASGDLVYDTYVSPSERITDYRTQWSGIRAKDLVGAPPKAHVVDRVKGILQGRVLVGHALQNDLDALGLSHPESHIRDSAQYPEFMRRLISGKLKPRALRLIVAEELNLTIQTGEHDSVQDARAVLGLYNKHKASWEAWHAKEMKRRLKRKRR